MKWRSLEESGEYSDTRPLREIFAERKALDRPVRSARHASHP